MEIMAVMMMCVMFEQPVVSDYDPVHFVRCHFADKKALRKGHCDNDPTDGVTNVWCCAMEPDPDDSGLVIDCILACTHVAILVMFY